MGSYAYGLLSIVGVISNLGATVLGLSTTNEAAASVTAVSPMVVNIVTSLAVGLIFSLSNAGAEGAARRGAVDMWPLPRRGKIILLPVADCSDSRRSYWSITAHSIHSWESQSEEHSSIRTY